MARDNLIKDSHAIGSFLLSPLPNHSEHDQMSRVKYIKRIFQSVVAGGTVLQSQHGDREQRINLHRSTECRQSNQKQCR